MVTSQTITHIMLMFILAVITHKIVSISSYLHEIGKVQEPYAVFTFSDNRYSSMTTNILINIFISSVNIKYDFVVYRSYSFGMGECNNGI